MHNKYLLTAASLTLAAFLAGLSGTARAQTFVEVGDAGQTLATAQSTGANNTSPLSTITGTISPTFTDADLYRITITNTTTFSATASSPAGIDTSLFLFNSAGVPVIANDDQSNSSFQGRIPAGNSLLTSLSPGLYYLAIALSGNEAVNSNNQQLFTVDQPTTNVRGIASGLNPTTLSTFNGGTFFNETGAYSIALTGANSGVVPEPSTWALAGSGVVALGFVMIRRRRQQVA